MKKALEGLEGVTKVELDLEHDLFRVSLSEKNPPTQDAVFAVIKDLNYTPSAASAASFSIAPTAPASTGEAPAAVREALAKAKAEKKIVLVDLMGDN